MEPSRLAEATLASTRNRRNFTYEVSRHTRTSSRCKYVLLNTSLYIDACLWLLVAVSTASVALLRPSVLGTLADALPVALVFAALAAASSRIASLDEKGRPVRLALSFILSAFEALPALPALLVLAAALAGGAGGGVAGPSRRGGRSAAALSVGAAIAALAIPRGSRYLGPGSLGTLGYLAAFFAVVQGAAFLAAALPRGRLPERRTDRVERSSRRLLLEAINVPLAWCLAAFLREQAFALALSLAFAILFGGIAMKALDRALADLKVTNDVLAARLTELATLHAIGREMLSSLDPARVFSVVERECPKVLDLDGLAVTLVDPDTAELRVAHRWARLEPSTVASTVPSTTAPDGLARWVALEKRPLMVDDLHEKTEALPFRTDGIPPDARSVLAVPLVVEGRVIGVLSVRSSRPHAYDEHQISVLTTIAQQAAVAIENARHYEMATVDSLTRLFLRDYFHRRLEEEHNRARRYGGSFAVLMLDLDDFKEINDRHGHLHGDRYLRALGLAIRSRLRAADLACRYGGDEFCLLLPETDLEGARIIAERLRKTVSRLLVEAEDATLRTTASIGVAVFPQHDSGDLHGLLLRADQALYQAKRAGRDRVVPFAA
jgi:diguanylate cyclase (GGDEF)-like protein